MCNSTPTVATAAAYSEWRPNRWLVTMSTGRSFGLFDSHDHAASFAEGVRASFASQAAAGDYISLRFMPGAGRDTWLGDNIGCSAGKPARIAIRDQFGIERSLSVAVALATAADLDAYGLTRVVLGLRTSADRLHPADLAAWLAHEAEYPVRAGDDLEANHG